MTDFFDWLTAVDSGLGADRMRERFRLSEEEMRRTTEALAPAFLLGLQRLAADTSAWADFVGRMAALGRGDGTGATASTPASLLADLFGTRALAESIARQASMTAGVSPDTIAKMMPELGLMTIRTMMQMAGTPGAFPSATPADAGGLAVAEMMRRSANAVEALSRPSGSRAGETGKPASHAYLESLFADALKGGFPWNAYPFGFGASPAKAGGAERKAAASKETAPSPFFAFAPLFAAFPDPASRGTAERPEPEARGAGTDEAEAPADLADPLAGMARAMEQSRSLQESYAREMLALFDRYRPKAG